MRKAAGLTGDRMAADLGWGRPKISKIENGRQLPSAEDIRAWAQECGHPEAAPELLEMLTDIQATHRQWRGRMRHGHAPVQEDYDRRTKAAKHIRAAEIVIIPGLLQTASYARAIMTQIAAEWGTTDVDAAVEVRMRRQEVLYDQSKTFEFAVAEAALRLLPCPPQVMLGQLDRLLSLDLDNVTLGIIPMGIQLDTMPLNSFLLIDDQAVIESHGGEDEPGKDESAAYARIFEQLMAEAATGTEARRLITAAAADLRD